MLLALALAALARPAAAAIPSQLPPQGLYEACGPSENGPPCADRLTHMRSGGFTLVLNYRQWWATEAALRDYAQTADRLGMKIIWPFDSAPWRTGGDLRARYPQLAATCGCSDNAGFTRYVVGLVKDMPATWGYYVGDEVPEAEHAQAIAFADQVKALDPGHPTMVVSVESQNSRAANLAPFARTADVLAGDYYPIGTEPVDSLGPIAAGVGDMARAHGRPAGMVLQAFSWEMYPHQKVAAPRWPTAAEMQRMRDLSLDRAGASVILWYSYFDIRASADPERHWADLVAGAFAPLPTPEPAPEPTHDPGPRRAPAKPVLRVPSRVSASRRRRALRTNLSSCGRRSSLTARSACRSAARRRHAVGGALRWRLAGTDRAELTLYRVSRGRRVRIKRMWVEGHAGSIDLERLVRTRGRTRPGAYAVSLRSTHGAGVYSARSGARFRVLP